MSQIRLELPRPIKKGQRGLAFGHHIDSLQTQTEFLAEVITKLRPGRGGGGSALIKIDTVVGIGLYNGKIYPGSTITGTADIASADLGTIGTTDVLLYNVAEFLNDGAAALDPAASDNIFVAHGSGITASNSKPVYITFARQSEICSSLTGTASILSLNGGY